MLCSVQNTVPSLLFTITSGTNQMALGAAAIHVISLQLNDLRCFYGSVCRSRLAGTRVRSVQTVPIDSTHSMQAHEVSMLGAFELADHIYNAQGDDHGSAGLSHWNRMNIKNFTSAACERAENETSPPADTLR